MCGGLSFWGHCLSFRRDSRGVVRASADDLGRHRFEAGHLERQAGDRAPAERSQGNVSVPEMTARRGPDPRALAHLLRVPRPASFLGPTPATQAAVGGEKGRPPGEGPPVAAAATETHCEESALIKPRP